MAVALCLLALSLVPLLTFLDRIQLLVYLYPLCAFAIGFWLYAKAPVMYVSFTIWIWFVTPLVRRLLDYEAGYWDPLNPVMLTPLVVTLLSGITLLRFGGRLKTRTFFPFVLLLCGLLFGFLIGAVRVGIRSGLLGLLGWLPPLLLGIHIALNWRQYPAFKTTLRSTFAWGLLLVSSYGIVQYFVAPPWDMLWLEESDMWLTMGSPEARRFRVFGTLNSTGPFAFVVCALLLFLMDGKRLLTKVAMVPGYLSFLLTLVRSAWLGWFVGTIYLVIWRLKGRLRTRIIGGLVAITLLGIPFFVLSPDSQDVYYRAQTFTNLQGDDSFQVRLGIYLRGIETVAKAPLGYGLGSFGVAAKLDKGKVVSLDSGVLGLFLSLGWVGGLSYALGIVLLLRKTVFTSELVDSMEPFLHAVTVAFLFMLLSINQFAGPSGIMFWTALGLAYAVRLHAANEVNAFQKDEHAQRLESSPSRASIAA
jgi:hypothetical protein